MESLTKFTSSWPYSQESAVNITLVVVGNPHLFAGFLLGYLLLGLIVVIMAFWSQRSKFPVFKQRIVFFCISQKSNLRQVQNLQDSFLTLLVIMDIINGVTSIVLAVHFILETCGSTCNFVFIVWFLSKSFGIVLHLSCALISVLHFGHPHWRVILRIISTVVLILTAVFIPLYFFLNLVGFIGLAVITFGLALAIIAQSCGSTVSPSAAASIRWIVFVAMFTFLVFYLPTFVLQCLISSYPGNSDYLVIFVNLVFGTNFQLAADGFLCLLHLSLPAEVEEEQQHSMESLPPCSLENKSVTVIQHGDASPPFSVWTSSQSNLTGVSKEKS